jgi:glycosyltransferase involved in cell wall biosynthesis
MRIAWFSNVPWGPTGYGTQTAQVLRRMKADGHEVAVLANWGQQVGMGEWEGVTVFPQGALNYSLDVVNHQATTFFGGQRGVVFTLYDVWPLGDPWPDHEVVSWVPVDHMPVPPKVAEWCARHRTIAMARYGQQQLAEAGIESTYIPHGIDAVYAPTPSDVRTQMRVPDDAYLVSINAANIGNVPPRKAWNENIQALAHFMQQHDDAYVYIHTDMTRPGGMPIGGMAAFYGLPLERLRVPDQQFYRWGTIPAEELARVYTASDVLLSVSMGEGFGLAVPEAMACGTPAIVTDFSAQPELVGDTGWKVKHQGWYDAAQHAAFVTPLVGSIVHALEASYAERGTEIAAVRRDAAREQAAQYDADHVWATHWRPYLAALEADLAPKARPGNTKSAKRRAKKAA